MIELSPGYQHFTLTLHLKRISSVLSLMIFNSVFFFNSVRRFVSALFPVLAVIFYHPSQHDTIVITSKPDASFHMPSSEDVQFYLGMTKSLNIDNTGICICIIELL